MHFDWSTLVLQTVNLLVLCWLLRRFLYRPVLAAMDRRRKLVDEQMACVEQCKAQAEAELAAVETVRSHVDEERDALLSAAATKAEAMVQTRLDQARKRAATILEDARKDVAQERAVALEEAKTATMKLAVSVAAHLLAASPPAVQASAWIELIEEHLAALPADERQALCRQLGAEGELALKVVTATGLPSAERAAWRDRIAGALGMAIRCEFAVAPDLLGGAELYFPNAILRFSWKDALTRMRLELEKADAAD